MNIESLVVPLVIFFILITALSLLVAMKQRYPNTPGSVLFIMHTAVLCLAMQAGMYVKTEAVYSACRDEGWYLVQGSGDLYQRRVIECTGWNGQEVEDQARDAFNRNAM